MTDFLKRCPTCGQFKSHGLLEWSKSIFMWLSGLGFLTFLLYQEATLFDETELRTLAKWGGGIFLAKLAIQTGGKSAVEAMLRLADKKIPNLPASNHQGD